MPLTTIPRVTYRCPSCKVEFVVTGRRPNINQVHKPCQTHSRIVSVAEVPAIAPE